MGKLVRDKIPQIIKNSGRTPSTRVMETDEYRRELYRKVGEEFREYRQAETTLDKAEEMADILTVLKAITELDAVFVDDVTRIAKEKSMEKGEFTEKIYLDIPKNSE